MSRKDRKADALLQSALRQLQQGTLADARLYCEQALRLAPRHPEALHLLGIIALQKAEHPAAIDLLQQATALRPGHSVYQTNLAYAFCGANRMQEALAAFQRATRLDPADPEIQLGVGSCLGMLGRPAEAEMVLRDLVERHPRFAHGWFNLGRALEAQARLEEACTAYRRAIDLEPSLAEAHGNLGLALHALGRYEEAEQPLRYCLASNPGFVAGYVNLAIALNSLRRHEEAESLCREALARNPGQKGAGAMLARALSGQGRWIEALPYFQQAVLEEPDNPALLGYLADTLARSGRTSEALAAFDRVLEFGEVPPIVHFSRAVALLGAGRIREGMAEYVHREFNQHFIASHPELFAQTEARRITDPASVCLLGEQGLGDEIFFLRYAPLLKARGHRVTYHGSPKLASILARSEALDRVLPHSEPYAEAAHTVFVGDLPVFLDEFAPLPADEASPVAGSDRGDSVKANGPRIDARWPRLPPPLPLAPLADLVLDVTARLRRLGQAPYIGLTWRAGTETSRQRGRVWRLYKEIAPEQLGAALRDVPGTLISLQRHPWPGETERVAAGTGRPVHDLSAVNENLEQMLAWVAVLDDYVGVSNTNVHLRASAGRTARVLVPRPPEWRWMNSGSESPWFPGFTLYRQSLEGDWDAALGALERDLIARFGEYVMGSEPP
jgi:tetratricopeptide (TPR) repeat protein